MEIFKQIVPQNVKVGISNGSLMVFEVGKV